MRQLTDYTEAEIREEMPAGAEMDYLVTEYITHGHLPGHQVHYLRTMKKVSVSLSDGTEILTSPSTSIADAWRARDEMIRLGWMMSMVAMPDGCDWGLVRLEPHYMKISILKQSPREAPLAICRVALLATWMEERDV